MTESARPRYPAGQPLAVEELALIDSWWRACNYLSVGMIYLRDNPLLEEPLKVGGFTSFWVDIPTERAGGGVCTRICSTAIKFSCFLTSVKKHFTICPFISTIGGSSRRQISMTAGQRN